MSTKSKKRSVIKAPASASDINEAKAAFNAVLPELQSLPAADLLAVNFDIPRAVSVVLGAEPHILAFEPQIRAFLPK
jgi:hypothetical protein